MELLEIKEKIKAENITSIRLEFSDLNGICRNKIFPANHLERVAEEGLNFAKAVYAATLANDIAPGSGCCDEIEWRDMTMIPDLDTFAILPHHDGVARLIGNAHSDGVPLPVDPRFALQNIIEKFEKKGLRPVCASELEFFLFNPATEGLGELYNPLLGNVYQLNPMNDRLGFLQKLQKVLMELGLDIIYMNHEFFPSQYEINWSYSDALTIADQSFTFKYVCKEMAFMNDLKLTFMGRPSTDGGGSGYHIHLSLSDPDTRKNLFDDPDGKHGMSDLMRYFIGGQMAHAKGMTALLAPTINSYKRYVPDSFAPYYLAWGMDNRTVYCRVPGERGPATRIENRSPCASANPYLVYAAAFAAGLDGIENRIDPGEFAEGHVYAAEPGTYDTIPFYLNESLEALKADKVLCDYMGPELIQAFVALKEDELNRFRRHVTDWEIREYSSLL